MSSKSKRDSNIELMRIIMMLMILIHHVICHGIYSVDSILCHVGPVNSTMAIALVVNSFCYIGVNGFILISGYYGITFKLRSLLNLYLICAFYSFIMHGIEIFVWGTKEICLGTIKDVVLVFSQQDYWWFIRCYVILYLMSPMLNKALNIFDKKEFQITLVLLTIANLYFGYWWGRYNENGYNVAQFVYMYVIGRYIGRFIDLNSKDLSRKRMLMTYVLFMFIYSALSICSHYVGISHWKSFPYNNPLLILGAVAFLLFMLSFHFNSLLINRIAKSCLSIYLLQNFDLMKRSSSCIQGLIGINWEQEEGVLIVFSLLLYLIGFALVFASISVLFDQVRLLLTSPIMHWYDGMRKTYNEYLK